MPCLGSHHRCSTRTTEKSTAIRPADHARPAVADMSVIAPVIRKNFRTRRHFGVRSSKWPNRMLPTANSEAITATSIQRFMAWLLAGESLPQKIGVQHRDAHRDRPCQQLHPQRARERPHLVAIAGE